MIPFLDLHQLNKAFKAAFQKKFADFFDSGYYVLGNSVNEFETKFAGYCGTNFCIGTGNGLDALKLILRGYIELGKLHEGEKVIVAANTYIATILAIKQAGLEPVLVEPEDKTFNLDPEEVRKKITSKTRAILVTHLYGQLADMQTLSAIAMKNNMLLITDSAQAHGAVFNSEKSNETHSGSPSNFPRRGGELKGDASGFSFYPTKNLGALGDAGAVTTDDKQLAEIISALRNYGSTAKYKNDFLGYNSRLDELQAGFLLEKLKVLDEQNATRQKIAKRYLNEIKNDKIRLPFWDGSENHVFHLFVVRVADREKFSAYLNENGIGYLVHYPIPPHRQKALSEFADLDFPITEKIHEEVVSIPLNPMLSNTEVDKIIDVLNTY